jgi:hypothetical protein
MHRALGTVLSGIFFSTAFRTSGLQSVFWFNSDCVSGQQSALFNTATTSPWRPPTTALLCPPIRLITSINTAVTKKTLHPALLWPRSRPLLPSICYLSVGVTATPLDAMAITATEYAMFTRLQQPPHTALCNKCDLRSSAAFPRCTSSLHSRHQNEAKLNFFSANFGSAFS